MKYKIIKYRYSKNMYGLIESFIHPDIYVVDRILDIGQRGALMDIGDKINRFYANDSDSVNQVFETDNKDEYNERVMLEIL